MDLSPLPVLLKFTGEPLFLHPAYDFRRGLGGFGQHGLDRDEWTEEAHVLE